MLETISKIKENIDDDETLKNLSLIEYELTKKKYGLVGKNMRKEWMKIKNTNTNI